MVPTEADDRRSRMPLSLRQLIAVPVEDEAGHDLNVDPSGRIWGDPAAKSARWVGPSAPSEVRGKMTA
jgi:hypothetical protein